MDRMLVVGDSLIDLRTALATSFPFCGVAWVGCTGLRAAGVWSASSSSEWTTGSYGAELAPLRARIRRDVDRKSAPQGVGLDPLAVG